MCRFLFLCKRSTALHLEKWSVEKAHQWINHESWSLSSEVQGNGNMQVASQSMDGVNLSQCKGTYSWHDPRRPFLSPHPPLLPSVFFFPSLMTASAPLSPFFVRVAAVCHFGPIHSLFAPDPKLPTPKLNSLVEGYKLIWSPFGVMHMWRPHSWKNINSY